MPDFLQLESVTADIRCHSSPQRDLRHFSSSLFLTFHPILHFSSYKALFISSTGFAPLFIFCFSHFSSFFAFFISSTRLAPLFNFSFLRYCFLKKTCTLNSCFYALFNRSLEVFVTFFALFICILCNIHPFFLHFLFAFHAPIILCFALFIRFFALLTLQKLEQMFKSQNL